MEKKKGGRGTENQDKNRSRSTAPLKTRDGRMVKSSPVGANGGGKGVGKGEKMVKVWDGKGRIKGDISQQPSRLDTLRGLRISKI